MNRIGIIGGGASGVLAALQLLRAGSPPEIHLFHEGPELGRGVAYSAGAQLLLNVPAERMSAWPDEPGHFHQWLEEKFPGRYFPTALVSRHLYGTYLQETLQAAIRGLAPDRFQVHAGRVDGVRTQPGRYVVKSGGGKEVAVDRLILALGNLPPADPHLQNAGFVRDLRYLANVWKDGPRLREVRADESVLILGSGLTAVDAILQLRGHGHRGQIDLLSRRGQWPSLHDLRYPKVAGEVSKLAGLSPRQVLRHLRQETDRLQKIGGNWRQVIDGLRPQTNAIWAAWNLSQRRQFMRHLRPYWDVHRHRMAPEMGQLIAQEASENRLRLRSGRAISITGEETGLRVAYRLRRQDAREELSAGMVINCTGSETLRRNYCQPLIQSLLDGGLADLDPLGLGLATDSTGALLNPRGERVSNLYALGPIRRGSLWETTAVPEIRSQAEALVQMICG